MVAIRGFKIDVLIRPACCQLVTDASPVSRGFLTLLVMAMRITSGRCAGFGAEKAVQVVLFAEARYYPVADIRSVGVGGDNVRR